MKEKYLQLQSTLLRLIEIINHESNINDLLKKSFKELMSYSSEYFISDKSLFILREKESLHVGWCCNSNPEKCMIDRSGLCLCEAINKADDIIFCEHSEGSDDFVINWHNCCIPFIVNNQIRAAFIIHLAQLPDEFEIEFLKISRSLIENSIASKIKESELREKAQLQKILNQKLFSQSLEIDQKNIEIKENEQKIKEQYEELQSIESELRRNNEELQHLLANIETQKLIIEEEERRLQAIIENQAEGLIIFKLDSSISFANISASEILGSKREELIGRDINDFIQIQYILHAKEPVRDFDATIRMEGQGEKYLLCNLASDYDKNGEQIGYILTFIDDTIRKKQKELLEQLNDTLTKSKEKINNAHTEILSSINYAKTIQQSLFTHKDLISKYLDRFFILFEPKTDVSGDFYYVNKIDKNIFIAVADCTGHGVAGGLLTMLGITYLHEVIKYDKTHQPGQILNILRKRFKRTFKTFGSTSSNGLDIALCVYNKESNTLHYSGANNPLWIVRNNELIEYKATKNPIGYYPNEQQFITQEIKPEADDTFYLFSDGYKDQFGGEENTKFLTARFRDLLIGINRLPMVAQKHQLASTFQQWKGKNEQTDDVLVLGFQLR